jgi:catechol 2,3-dioxygenase-like lactoylglutathione lyase family enzyme
MSLGFDMIKRVNHIGMSVRDLDRSIAFYCDLLDMELVIAPIPFGGPIYETIMDIRGAAGKVAVLRKAGVEIELFEFSTPPPQPSSGDRQVCEHGISHFCLEVFDIESEYERLKAAGVVFHCSPQNFRDVALATYARDPDGNVFELLELLEEPSDRS